MRKKIIFNCFFLLLLLFYFIFYILKIFLEHFTTNNNFKYSDKLTIENIKNLKKGQEIMTEMFKDFDRICRKYNLKYWCLGGTLIGVIRHKGWIPWDGDIDIGMLEEDYDKFKEKAYLLSSFIEFSEPKDKPCSKLRSIKAKYIYTKWSYNWDTEKGVHIDIFVFKKDNNYIYSNNNNNSICGTPDKPKRKIEDIFPLKRKHFEDFLVYIPNKYKKISEELWGGYPPKMIPIEKRFPHEGNIQIIENNFQILKL